MYLNGDVSWVSQPESATARLEMGPVATGGLCVGETTPKSAGASPATGWRGVPGKGKAWKWLMYRLELP